jgi:hypothetical protein
MVPAEYTGYLSGECLIDCKKGAGKYRGNKIL